ncbi:hypothetical protein [Halopenitus persicus]|uniref:hypothetical protein n=1 Tax=Halopenitus persicus TaxID=1048396 RepID=UPI000BBB118D|nr:hypothetical protein [Halopenitus persicus]
MDDFDAIARAAVAAAEAADAMDPSIVEDAVRYAREERGTGQSRYRSLLVDVAGAGETERAPRESGDGDPATSTGPGDATPTDRQRVAYARLRGHVERRRGREADVDGLFD